MAFSIVPPLFAADDGDVVQEEIVSTDSAEMEEKAMEEEKVEEVDSFKLFWPIVAGKTRGERFYSLKKLKETLRGWFIFGDAKDAEYELFLATKRVVEAEKLIKDGESEDAKETLEDAIENVEEAADEWEDVDNKDTTVKHEMNNKLSNLETFLPYLAEQSSDAKVKEMVNSLLDDVKSLNEKV